MSEHAQSHSYKGYWILWVVLLTLTVTMIFIGESTIATGPQALLLLLGSAIKASLIIFFYMHLRFERMSLILVVMVGIFVTSILMFVIPAYDGGHILEHRLFQ
jgi:caa(3)-type oxidase subunit IV